MGNRVHHFNLLAPNLEVRALAASVVDTHPRPMNHAASAATWPLDPDTLPLAVLDFVQFRGPVNRTGRLTPLVTALQPKPGDRVIDVALRISTYINGYFEYAPAATSSSSPIDDVLEKGKGVCQDFAHLMLGLLRTFGVPARYVSGYIHRPGKESQSQIWRRAGFCEHHQLTSVGKFCPGAS